MKPMFRLCLCLAAALLLALSCESEVREANINQNKYIDDYITKNYSDKEIVRYEGVVRVVLANNLPTSTAIESGDSALLYLNGFTFGQSGPQSQFTCDTAMVRVGKGQLITGLDRGLIGARLGQEALILFPSQLGYGKQTVGLVPENTALLFDVLVAAIKKND
ncbi:MAG: FKBP-type peptidyl-prolyl cis-trans isomerase [Bacteroidales bacterium]|nr:FKBP-type peptidyl-prolyl cis-trans isomerase [Bacteroidales bacterium]